MMLLAEQIYKEYPIKMRYQQAAALEKMRFEQEEMNERKRDLERDILPVKLACEKEYESARAWFDPIGNSLSRIKAEILERESRFINSNQTNTPQMNGSFKSAAENGTTRNGVTFQIYSSTDSNLHTK